MNKILITGASGFIGSFIVEEALRRDMEVWAAVRRSSSRRWLTDERINFIELDLSSPERLKVQLAGHRFDYVVHAAGVTKCLHRSDFMTVNLDGTRHLVETLLELDMPLTRFVFISSLSIFGAIREQQPYTEIRDTDTPQPNTAYGQSKLETERYLESVSDRLPYVILRPTGVYGPREQDYYLMAKSIASHVDFAVGYKRQDITFVYVRDVVQAVFLALDRGANGSKYFLTDGGVYRSTDFSNLLIRNMGNPRVVRITAPVWLLRIVTYVSERISRITGKATALNSDKYNILRQRNWRCDIRPAEQQLGYRPQYNLERGVAETVAWYKDNKWL